MDNFVYLTISKYIFTNLTIYSILNIVILKYTNQYHKKYLLVFLTHLTIFEAYIVYFFAKFEFNTFVVDLFIIISFINFASQLIIFLLINSMYTSLTVYLLRNIQLNKKIIIQEELLKFAKHSANMRFQRTGLTELGNKPMKSFSTKAVLFVQELFQRLI